MPQFTSSLSYHPHDASIPGYPAGQRRLSSMDGYFADRAAFQECLRQGDPLVYQVTNVAPADGEGQLHYGLGMIMPGKVGAEYYLTRGHVHAWLPAAEVYICLSGQGIMLLQDTRSGACSA